MSGEASSMAFVGCRMMPISSEIYGVNTQPSALETDSVDEQTGIQALDAVRRPAGRSRTRRAARARLLSPRPPHFRRGGDFATPDDLAAKIGHWLR
jgi:hypothetical protein